MTFAETDIAGPSRDSSPVSLGLLWFGAAATVLAAHGAVAFLALRPAAPSPAEAGPPPAVMIDLAPEAAAPEAEMDQIAPDAMDAPEAPPPPDLPPMPETPEAPPQTPRPPAPREITEAPLPPAPPSVAPPKVAMPEAAPPKPMARPENLPRPAPAPEPEPKPEPEPTTEPPREERRRAQAQQPQSAAAPAAPETSRSAGSNMSPAQWQSRLLAHLERRKRYPARSRSLRQEGVAQVRFMIDAAGNVLSARLARSSGVPALDEEAVAMVQRASPVPAPPPGAPQDLTVPVQFDLR